MVGFTSEQEPCSLCGEKPARVWVWPGQSRECRRPEDPSVQGRCGGGEKSVTFTWTLI